MYETLKWLSENPKVLDDTPAAFHTYVQRLARKITGNLDPFKELKRTSNEIALKVVKALEKECSQLDFKDTFRLAVLGTLCGNTIDFEVEGHQFSIDELESSLLACLKEDLSIDDTPKIIEALSKSKNVIYLLDNAGEIVFDKFFIKVITENFPVKVYAVVKKDPILNDATIEDAEQIKLSEVAEVTDTGNDHIGLNLKESSKKFLDLLTTADFIIAKGQGNFESMTEIENILPKPIAYILRAKCSVVADALKVPRNGNVVKVIT